LDKAGTESYLRGCMMTAVGSQPELSSTGLMSALASCGHNAKSGFVSTVPQPDLSRCSKLQPIRSARRHAAGTLPGSSGRALWRCSD
jgi:hypothetical protein